MVIFFFVNNNKYPPKIPVFIYKLPAITSCQGGIYRKINGVRFLLYMIYDKA